MLLESILLYLCMYSISISNFWFEFESIFVHKMANGIIIFFYAQSFGFDNLWIVQSPYSLSLCPHINRHFLKQTFNTQQILLLSTYIIKWSVKKFDFRFCIALQHTLRKILICYALCQKNISDTLINRSETIDIINSRLGMVWDLIHCMELNAMYVFTMVIVRINWLFFSDVYLFGALLFTMDINFLLLQLCAFSLKNSNFSRYNRI